MSWREKERCAGGDAGGRGAGILAGRSPGTASILLAFLAAVSFRGMRAPLAATATPMENASLIAPPATGTTTMALDTGSTGSPVLMLGDGQQELEDTTVLDSWSDRPDTATLTKGFSIPTYLPPFPEFIPADIPHRQQNATPGAPVSVQPADNSPSGSAMPSPNEQSRLHAYDSEQKAQQLRREKELAKERELLPRRQLSLPPLNATVQAGQHAYLPCKLNQHSGKPLSWVRLRDEHIIAVDHTTFINDARFASLLQSSTSTTIVSGVATTENPSVAPSNVSAHGGPDVQERGNGSSLSWTLQIKYVKVEDAGWYECQLATEPKMSAKVQLFVITPRTELIGDRQRFVKSGSKVELHCIVRGTLEAPKYIFWYRGDQQVTADNEASGVQSGWYTQIDRNIFGSTEHNRNTIGSLVIPLVRKIHSGNYTCEPENSAAVSMQLHVLSGEYSASAIKSAAAGLHRLGHGYSSLHQWLIFLLVALNKT
ncbi:uncharacterized protein LOC108141181 isoform X1 [Drosophila elegans]|uniref:uncharacterized protein LOC108141181 isoform X1 n=1 Tax=Drosophila elegans TaxID=30023 RepID=UPI0007E8A771|nr:uncharacterized protein LOC108141181 isoform X1 [Drosophila elegans]XP_017119906.1 uncharacterized protein LOC108141181 isoform X1 [Drosophila elegans]XP_017119907.1 uncharacterized protein LOC108141181 isoform X1 [Drosophila elegans]XP_041565398.1 uncharacterized protein LOC108141181 isoform X1 [Drosophila elegans]XP_041565399.1 uncharacterized protein LOC108141181 isoform X1 [Drosophila elegans]